MDRTFIIEGLIVAAPVFMIIRTLVLRGKKLLD
jgi:hypothetical protein